MRQTFFWQVMTTNPLASAVTARKPTWLKSPEDKWEWLTPEQHQQVATWVNPAHRQQEALRISQTSDVDPQTALNHATLLLTDNPALVFEVVSSVLDSVQRDEVCLALIEGNRLAPDVADQLRKLIGDPVIGNRFNAHQSIEYPNSDINDTYQLLKGLNKDDYIMHSTLQRALLRTVNDMPVSQQTVDRILINEVQTETVDNQLLSLRFWANATLQPELGHFDSNKQSSHRAVKNEISNGLTLSMTSDVSDTDRDRDRQPEVNEDSYNNILRLYRKWENRPRHHWWWLETSRESFNAIASMVGLGSVMVVLPFDIFVFSLFNPDIGDELTIFSPGIKMAGALGMVLLYFLNGWLIDKYLNRQTGRHQPFKRSLYIMRRLVAGIPLLGIFVIPFWQWLIEKKPAWAISRRSETRAGRSRPLVNKQIHMLSELLAYRAWPAYNMWGLFLINLIGIFASTAVVFRHPPSHACLIKELAIGSFVHLFLTVLMAVVYVQNTEDQRAQGLRRYLRLPLLLTYLIPYPFLSLGGVLFMTMSDRNNQKGELIASAFSRRNRIERSSLWFALQDSLRANIKKQPWWQRLKRADTLDSQSDISQADKMVYYGITIKLAALVGETALLMRLVIWLQNRFPAFEAVTPIILGLFYIGLGVVGIGLLVRIVAFILHIFDLQLPYRIFDRPYSGVIITSAGAFSGGVLLGVGLSDHMIDVVSGTIFVAGMIQTLSFALSSILGLFVPVQDDSPFIKSIGGTLWSLFWIGMVMISVTMVTYDNPLFGDLAFEMIQVVTYLLPLGTIITFGILKWLLWPFEIKDRLASDLSSACRRGITFIEVTAGLPFGGLFTAYWLHLRETRWADCENQRFT